jgi:two-component system, NarL family, sensor histidine kinase DesK
MTTAALWTPQRPFRFMVAATVAVALVSPGLVLFGTPGAPAQLSVQPVLLGAVLIALQLWHSVAASRGERPLHGYWTLLAMAVVVYAPLPWFTYNWASAQALLMASAPMVLRSRGLAVGAVAAPVAGTALFFPLIYGPHYAPAGWSVVNSLWEMGWWGIGLPMSAAVVYGAAWMVRGASELLAARTELAELAIAEERLRISRDLHDLVGQNLSAVSLRGDLALRLLDTDPRAAEAEIANLTATAREALHDVLNVTGDSGRADLRTEADGATALLAAAGIDATVDLRLAGLAPVARNVFAWALREGVTNVLRHSDATECAITLTRTPAGAVQLEIVNDGVQDAAAGSGTAQGNGLIGLAERARAFSGELTAGPLPGGRYRLLIELPEEAP